MQILPLMANDAETIVKWNENKDADFLEQWAGRGYSFPITIAQIHKRIELQTQSDYSLFKIVTDDCVIGTIELMNINREENTADVGRFLLNPQWTGKGFGTKAMHAFLKRVFRDGIEKVSLFVFDNNLSAFYCYQNVGFKVVDRIQRPNGRTVIRMEIKNKKRTCR